MTLEGSAFSNARFIKPWTPRKLDEIEIRTEEYASFSYQIANDAQHMLNVLACYKQDYDWRWKDTWHRKKNGASVLVELNNGDQIIESRQAWPLVSTLLPSLWII